MKKFKNLFFAGLACILALSMALPTIPAFALGNENLLPPGPAKIVLAEIKSMLVLESYPPQLKLTGTLPSPCYQLSVSMQGMSPAAENAGTGTVLVWVRGVAPRGLLCAHGVKSFTTTVVLDPTKLKLSPRQYMAMVNPVNGRSAFKMNFMVPVPQTAVGLATITKMVVGEAYPPQFKISGMLPSPCYTLRVSAPQVTGDVIFVFLRETKPLAVMCAQMLKPFSASITIDPVKLKLTPGKYTVLFNPVKGASRFKADVFVPGPD